MILDEVCELIVDTEHKTAPRQDTGYPSIRTPNIGRGRLELEGVYRVSEETYKIWTKRAIPQANDLILAREAPVGNVAIIPENLEVCLGQRTVLLRPKISVVHPAFLCYYLLSPEIQNRISSRSGGSTVAHLNMKDIRALELGELPTILTQKRISKIISNYDDLIENNLKRIKLLEEIAQNIYKEWFVDFRFPNYEHTEFDGESGLPKGWERINLYDFVEIKMGFPFKAEDFNEDNVGKPAIRIRDIPSSWTRTYTTQEVSEEYIVEQGDILIGMDGFFYLDIWRGQKGYLVQRVCRLKTKNQNLQGFLLESLRQPISYYEKTISGATVAHLGAKHLKEIFLSVPQDNLLLEELKVFNRLNSQKINLSNQNQKLKEARDILLPRLMNRTIEV